jgi:DNA-binding response OmpR family regulator
VLIVEPVSVLRTIMTRAFADRGHSVTAVASLDEMRRLLPSFDPHVVVCELALPDGSGDVACRRLKASANKLRPVVLISGVPEGELMRRARDAGADRFHCKSRGLSELIELVEELSAEIVF